MGIRRGGERGGWAGPKRVLLTILAKKAEFIFIPIVRPSVNLEEQIGENNGGETVMIYFKGLRPSKTIQHLATCCHWVTKCVQCLARNDFARCCVEMSHGFGWTIDITSAQESLFCLLRLDG